MPPIEGDVMADNNQQSKPMSGPIIGIIYPPPEVRNIVDKTASFVARNGPEFEARIRQNELGNPKFNFLSSGDPYHAYYRHKVNEFREGKDASAPSVVTGIKQLSVTSAAQQKQQELLKQVAEQQFVPKDPPQEFEFIADPPSISALDLDIVKLTAQFVARNGRQFLTNLMNREQRNFQFDFLRPQHSLFLYFTKLLEQYTKILIPPKDLIGKLRAESNSGRSSVNIVLDQVKYRANWQKHQEAQRRREEEKIEKERELDAAVPLFSGDDHYDVTKWFTQFDDYTNMCGYTDKEKCVGIRRRLEGTAKKYAANLGLLEYTQFKTSIVKLFKRTISRQEVYRQLRSRKLRPDESCISYLVSMQVIAAQADIEERELVDIIIDGIPDSNLATASLYNADTIDELVKRMERYEQRRHTIINKARPSTANKTKTATASGGDTMKSPDAEVRCFNCSRFGHYQDRCPKPKRPANSCFVCAEVGHFNQDCPRKKKTTADIIGGASEILEPYQTPN